MTSEVKAPAQCRNSKTRTFSDALYRLSSILCLFTTSRGLGVGVFDPLLASNVVFPDGVV